MAKIVSEKRNELLKRTEKVLAFERAFAPSFEEVKEVVGGDKDKIVVRKIEGNFGKHSFLAEVRVYDSKKYKDATEVIPTKVRKKMAEEEKKRKEEAKAKRAAEAKAAAEAAKKTEATE